MTPAQTPECAAMLAGISAYLDGDLEVAECQLIEAHCRECSRCSELVQGLRATIGLCREAGNTPLPEPVRERARASVRRLLATKPSGS
jgi:anti-sigma factor RsiW